MPRRSARLDGLLPVQCLVDEVHTGLPRPALLRKHEKAKLPPAIVADLIRSGACKSV